MYATLSPNEPRRVYFEGSNPTRQIMRVAKDTQDEDTVIPSYSWERSDPLQTSTLILVTAWKTCSVHLTYVDIYVAYKAHWLLE